MSVHVGSYFSDESTRHADILHDGKTFVLNCYEDEGLIATVILPVETTQNEVEDLAEDFVDGKYNPHES